MSLVFISYSRKDTVFVSRLVGDLQRAGIHAWFDQQDIMPGERWDIAIEEGLQQASHLLFVMSKNSVASPNCRDEINTALNLRKLVLPILIEDCPIPLQLIRIQYTDFRSGYAAQLQKIIPLLAQEPADTPVTDAAAPAAEPVPATPVQMATFIQQQIELSNRNQDSAQYTLTQLVGIASPNPLKLPWREYAFDPQTDGVLADLAASSPDQQSRQNASRTIAELGSAYAIDQLVKKLDTNRQRVIDALVWSREASRTLPDGVPPALRRDVFVEVSVRQGCARPLDLLFRYVLAVLGFGIAVSIGVAANFGGGSSLATVWRSAIALGILFGLLMGFPITAGIELSRRLKAWRRFERGVFALGISTMLVWFVLSIRFLLDLTSSAGGPLPLAYLLWSFLFAASFALPSLFQVQPLESVFTFVGVFAVICLSNIFTPGDGVINYRAQPIIFSLLAAVLIVGFTHVPEALTFITERNPIRAPR